MRLARRYPEVPWTFLETKPQRSVEDEPKRAEYVNFLWYAVYDHKPVERGDAVDSDFRQAGSGRT